MRYDADKHKGTLHAWLTHLSMCICLSLAAMMSSVPVELIARS